MLFPPIDHHVILYHLLCCVIPLCQHQRKQNFIIITIAANAFLQNMVRIMVGTLIDISKNENLLSIKEILEKRDRSFAGRTAPAKGLFFLGPKYNENIDINTYEKDLLNRLKT